MTRALPVALVLALALAGGAASAARLRAEEPLSEAQIKTLQALYQEASGHSMKGEAAKSNEAYQKLLAALPLPSEGRHDPDRARVLYDMAVNHVTLGNKKEAFEHLHRAVDAGYTDHGYLSIDSRLGPLRSEKDFPPLFEKCKRALGDVAFGTKDLKGNEIAKKDYEGKVLIIDVWGTWCPPCRAEIPHFVKLQEKYRDKGLRVIGLTWERGFTDEPTRKRVQSFAETNKINYPLIMASQRLLNSIRPPVTAFPTTLFVSAEGVVEDRLMGLEDYASLEARALKLLAKVPAAKGD
ncbi:MAG: TlpA family protein disulfide reductase [Planctomycetes bacterium]|nr:TlpA family protein disulfide reductase [Planctomycetota bacterium]